jgi:hypothetical protein
MKGVVEAVSTKFGKFSVMVDGNWYGTKEEWAPTPRPQKGDEIEFDPKGGKYLNKCRIVSVDSSTLSGGSSGPASAPKNTDRERAIIRQNALTNAVNFCIASCTTEELSEEEVIITAMKFEKYTSGDMLKEAASKAKAEMDEAFDVTDI